MKKILSFLVSALIIFSSSGVFADADLDYIIEQTGQILMSTVTDPQVGSIGGEWTVIGLAKSGEEVPDSYFEKYLSNTQNYIKAKDGVLHQRKYTEYSRVILALGAIGKDPKNFAGYNLLMPLADFEQTVWQGINGAIWALIALDSGNYDIPQNTDASVQATRDMYVDYILSLEKPEGGWSLSQSEQTPDSDVTAMALIALSNYNDSPEALSAIERGVSVLSSMQNEKGGFSSYNQENSESTAQVLTALSALGISADDPRFVKNGKTVIDGLLQFYNEGVGFVRNSQFNLMATEQSFYGLVAAQRMADNKKFIFDMTDSRKISNANHGLSGKNPDVKYIENVYVGKTFADIQNHINQSAIEELAQRGIINGMDNLSFCPDNTMTRAEFAAIITRGLGLNQKETSVFIDISQSDWYYGYISSAYLYGIVNGVAENCFEPNATITKEEAAVMTARAAMLCGMNTDMELFAAKNILAEFVDYVKVSDWAVTSLAFCYDKDILDRSEIEINPSTPVTRAEIAQILYNMLKGANLI